jgi:hypothetical protein
MANTMGVWIQRDNFYAKKRGIKLKFDTRDWKLSVSSARFHLVLPFAVYNKADQKYYLHNSGIFILPNDRVNAKTVCRLYLPPEEIEEFLLTAKLTI